MTRWAGVESDVYHGISDPLSHTESDVLLTDFPRLNIAWVKLCS